MSCLVGYPFKESHVTVPAESSLSFTLVEAFQNTFIMSCYSRYSDLRNNSGKGNSEIQIKINTIMQNKNKIPTCFHLKRWGGFRDHL